LIYFNQFILIYVLYSFFVRYVLSNEILIINTYKYDKILIYFIPNFIII